ncbi:transmembrane protein 70 homolog, mitochondrial [Apis dorsata]|uniref:transmembrane protein 70 homolog, mitochondrial n=1 Tax=Apis dorsata TaxID=7462 RepID=UPI0003DF6AE1|nr:transmembrane protein 70 homolog, mitochondrial [Apis dorsata]
MVLLLRNWILSRRKLFMQEVVLFRISMYHKCSNIKNITRENNRCIQKYTPFLQIRHFSDKNNKEDKELIYIGSMKTKVISLKVLSLLTTAMSAIFQPYMFMKLIEEDSLTTVIAILTLVNLITIGNPVFIHFATKRYAVEMHYYPKEEKYSATVYTLFLKRKTIKFTPNDVTESKYNFTLPLSTCYVKNKPLFFLEQNFINRKHYFIIMNYNKPIDFQMKSLNVNAINQSPIVNTSQIEVVNTTQIENKNENLREKK